MDTVTNPISDKRWLGPGTQNLVMLGVMTIAQNFSFEVKCHSILKKANSPTMTFVALWRLSYYDLCRIMTFVALWCLWHFYVCRIMMFVTYWVCLIKKSLNQCSGAATFLGSSGSGSGSWWPRSRSRLRLRPTWVGSGSRQKEAALGGSGSIH